MRHVKQVSAEFAEIPKERLATKIKRTVLGLLFVIAAGWGAYTKWPWYVDAALLGVGAHIISAELVQSAVKFAVATIKDLLPFKPSS